MLTRAQVFARFLTIMISMQQRSTVDDTADTPSEIVDAIVSVNGVLQGSGSPTFYHDASGSYVMLASYRDQIGHRMWRTRLSLLRRWVSASSRSSHGAGADLVGIIVNLKDYTIGADKGGEVNFFDDFDIDYNQYKYLTRLSGR